MGDRTSFIGCPIGSFKALKAYLRCLSSSKDIAGVSATSLISGPIGDVLNASVIDLTYLFISR